MKERTISLSTGTMVVSVIVVISCLSAVRDIPVQHRSNAVAWLTLVPLDYLVTEAFAIPENIRGNGEEIYRYFKNFDGTFAEEMDERDELTPQERADLEKIERRETEAMNRNLRRGPVDLPVGVAPVSTKDWQRRAAAAFNAVMDTNVAPGPGVAAGIERNLSDLDRFYEQQNIEGIRLDKQREKAQAAHEQAVREGNIRLGQQAAARAKFKAESFANSQGLQVVDDLSMPHADTFHRDLALIKFVRLGQLVQSLAMINILTVGDGSVPEGSFLGMGMGPGVRTLSDLEWRIARTKDALRLAEGGVEMNKTEEQLHTQLQTLEAQRTKLLATSGMPNTPALQTQRISYLNTLIPAAQNIRQKYDAWQEARGHHSNQMSTRTAQGQARGGSIPEQYIVTEADVKAAKAAMDKAKQEYLAALNGNGIMMVDIEHGEFEGPFWKWLAGFDGEQSVALDVMNQALLGLADTVRADIARIGELRYRSELLVEFGSPIYAPLRAMVVQQMQAAFPNIGLGMNFIASAYLSADLKQKLSNQELDTMLIAGQLTLAFFTVIFPPAWIITAPLSLTLGAWQLGYDVNRASEVSTRLEGGKSALAAGGSVDNRAVLTLQQAVNQQYFAVFMSAVGVGVDGMFFLKAAGGALGAAKKLDVQAPGAAARTGTQAGETLSELIPAGARPTVTATSNADEIIDGIDVALMSEFKTIQNMDGLQQFIRGNGLGPRQTAQIGGQTFHFSAPFMADGKLAVLVYQQAGGGGYLLRTFYRSESHGIFRAATGRVGGAIGKGRFTYLDNGYNPVSGRHLWETPESPGWRGGELGNPFQEFTADIAAELQGPLARWTGSQSLLPLDEAATNRAFWGHLEKIEPGDPKVWGKIDAGGTAGEFGLHAGRSTAFGELTPGMRPDLANPLDQWVIPDGIYRGANAAQFRSIDGNYIYTVIRDKDGIFVSSIQDATSGIGPFGTRWNAIDPGDFANPLFDYSSHIPAASRGPVRGAYRQNLGNANPLSDWFNDNWGNIGQRGANNTAWPGGNPALSQTLFDPGQTIFMNPNTVLPVPRGNVAPLIGATQSNPLILHTTREAMRQNWGLNLLPGTTLRTLGHVVPLCNPKEQAGPNSGFGPIGYRCPYGADQFTFSVNMPGFTGTKMQDWMVRYDVSHVETNGARSQQVNDPLFKSKGSWAQDYDDQWAIKRVGLKAGKKAPWDFSSKSDRPPVIAIIDTGIAWSHEDLDAASIWHNTDEIPDNGYDDDHNGYTDDIVGWNFIDDNNLPWDVVGHGTMVAGIIAASRDNGVGIAGINPGVRLMVLKALDHNGNTRASYLAEAIYYAANNGADIINLSVGGSGRTRLEQAAVDYAVGQGVLVIAAAGNTQTGTADYSPGGLRGVVTVTATGPGDEIMAFSNHGDEVDIAAPGVNILGLRAPGTDVMRLSTDASYRAGANFVGERKRYYRASGTSFSAPIVSATASLLVNARPGASVSQLKQMLLQSARDIDVPGIDRKSGYGLLNAAAAVKTDPMFFVDARIEGVSVVNKDGKPHLRVAGTADADKLKKAWIEIGKGDNPDKWKKVSREITKAVRGGTLGDIPASELAGATQWTLRIVTEHKNGRKRENRFVLKLG